MKKTMFAMLLVLTSVVASAQQAPAQKLPSQGQVDKILSDGCKLWACTTDAGAIAKMTDAERKLVQDKLQKISANATLAELQALLGPVFRNAGTQRPVWLGPDKDKKSQIAIYFKDDKVQLIRWLKLRQWLWERAPSPQ